MIDGGPSWYSEYSDSELYSLLNGDHRVAGIAQR